MKGDYFNAYMTEKESIFLAKRGRTKTMINCGNRRNAIFRKIVQTTSEKEAMRLARKYAIESIAFFGLLIVTQATRIVYYDSDEPGYHGYLEIKAESACAETTNKLIRAIKLYRSPRLQKLFINEVNPNLFSAYCIDKWLEGHSSRYNR